MRRVRLTIELFTHIRRTPTMIGINQDAMINKHQTSTLRYRCFNQGKIAFLSEWGIDACPYHEGTDAYRHWEEGWRQELFDAIDVLGALP